MLVKRRAFSIKNGANNSKQIKSVQINYELKRQYQRREQFIFNQDHLILSAINKVDVQKCPRVPTKLSFTGITAASWLSLIHFAYQQTRSQGGGAGAQLPAQKYSALTPNEFDISASHITDLSWHPQTFNQKKKQVAMSDKAYKKGDF